MTDQFYPPDPAEIEVSLFGPGYGEAIVVHLGDQQWLVVDSCLEPTSGTPAALHYLRALDVDVATAVKLIVATHWHDDHIRGISSVLRECLSARIALSAALRTKEFLKLVSLYGRHVTVNNSGLDELSEVFKILKERKHKKVHVGSADHAIANRLLHHATHQLGDLQFAMNVYSLSPSDVTVTLATLAFAELWPQDEAPKKRLLSLTPNRASVVLWLETGSHSCLLGADLEHTGDPETGWSAVLDKSIVINGSKAGAFKVAHHGGASGHEPRVWTDLLIPQPRAVLTPYMLGNRQLPTTRDAERINSLTQHAYITATPGQRRRKWTNPVVRDIVRQATRAIHDVHTNWGHVRLRCGITAPPNSWQVELFGSACSLRDITT